MAITSKASRAMRLDTASGDPALLLLSVAGTARTVTLVAERMAIKTVESCMVAMVIKGLKKGLERVLLT